MKGRKGRARAAASSSRDPMERFHDEWLGMVQPIDGLVVSKPALVDAQVGRPDDKTLRDRFLSHVSGDRIADLRACLADVLGLGPERWIEGDQLGERFRLAIPDTGQLLTPTRALVRTADSDPVALLWELPDGLALDARETVTGGWDYPPSAKLDRLLRHAGVPIGLLSNATHLRLMYAPHGASTGAITFPVTAMASAAGKPILDAFVMLLHSTRWFGVEPGKQLPALLAASREAQGRVTRELAEQVLDALHILLAGFEHAHTAAGDSALAAAYRDPELGPDHVYAGLLTCMLRLVFVLYAEDNDLLPVDDDFYAENLSVLALYEDLAADAGEYPDAMARRFGAYGRLLSLFRAIYFGVSHGSLRMPPRHGELFSPHVYRFLEGNREPSAPTDPAGRRGLDVPAIDDEIIYKVLRRLLVLGEERLSYKALDVEQIGSVYENLMGFKVVELTAESVRLKKSRAWIAGDDLAGEAQGARAKWLQDEAGLAKADADRAAKATAGHKKADAVLDALVESGAADATSRTPAGRFVIQPGAERRRSGSHYTPRSLTAPIVEKTLAPLLAALDDSARPERGRASVHPERAQRVEGPSSEALLSLKICDPAMGSGAFLVEAVRQLGDHVVAAWRREGQAGPLLPSHGPAHDTEDAVAQARRLVAQRCIYGVDKNPQAVTLAKLSLWLVTLAKDKPFSFLDHALRCGDSLVGLDIDQITAFHWDAGKQGQQLDLIDKEIRDVLTEAVFARERIVALAKDDSTEAHREKERLLADAQDAVGRLRLIGDLVLGAFFSSTKDKEREAERVRRRDIVAQWLGSGRTAPSELVELASEFRARIPAFHWMIEYPEVFWVERPDPLNHGERGGHAWIDALVGNPPFAGKNNVLAMEGGECLLAWLKLLHSGAHGNADYCAHFFRRATHLIGDHGAMGLIATNTISQGDTRASGLQPIVADGGVIYDATRTMPWPGEASVSVSVVHLARGVCVGGSRRLDNATVTAINSRLRAGIERSDPWALRANDGLSFVGSYVLGMGFVLTLDERDALIKRNSRNAERIFQYLGGDEINSSPTQASDRFVINFGDMSLEEAGRWPDLLTILREKVKPERDLNNREVRKKYWWRFGETTPALYAALLSLDRCLVTSAISKHRVFAFVSTAQVFSHNTYIFPLTSFSAFSALSFRGHIAWADLLSSGLDTRGGYRPSDCFETFPFPGESTHATVEARGRELYDARARYMVDTNQGLTATYNQLKDPDCTDEPIDRIRDLRRLHEELDRAVLAAYGWSDIAVPPYCPATAEEKAAVALFEDTVIDRLFALNAERAAEEAAAAGQPPPTAAKSAKPANAAKPKSRKSKAMSDHQQSLLDDE